MAQDKGYNGTMPKFLLEITASGFDMDRDDFEVVLNRGEKVKTITKAEMPTDLYTVVENNISIEKHHYYVCFDSAYFGPGMITAVVNMWVPDNDFPGGRRKIVDKFEFYNNLPV